MYPPQVILNGSKKVSGRYDVSRALLALRHCGLIMAFVEVGLTHK